MKTVASFDGDLQGVVHYLYAQNPEHFNDYIITEGTDNTKIWGNHSITISQIPADENIVNSSYCSTSTKGSHIIYHFKEHYIKLNNYTIKSRGNNNDDMMLGWILFGSNDKVKWTEIDKQLNVPELNNTNTAKTFTTNSSDFYRYFKLFSLYNSRPEYYYMCFSKIEFFGYLSKNLFQSSTFSSFTHSIYMRIFIFIFVLM